MRLHLLAPPLFLSLPRQDQCDACLLISILSILTIHFSTCAFAFDLRLLLMSLEIIYNNAPVLRSLYREIIRGLRRVCDKTPVLMREDDCSAAFQREIEKVSIDKETYREYLFSEIKHTVLQKFDAKPKHIKDHALYTKLWQGHDLTQKLSAIHSEPANASAWKELVEIVLAERATQLLKNKWNLDYKTHKKVIDEQHLKELNPLQAKRVLSKRKKFPRTISPWTDKGYKLLLSQSEDNASWVVRNYLKRLQLTDRIPNPFKLPYVSCSMHQHALQLPKTVNVIPGSTKTAVLNAAYDMDYVNFVLKSEIEYLINKRHYLERYQRIVNKKGPVKVQIKCTLSGIMQAHFLRSSSRDDKRMKQIAIDVKNLTRVKRKQFVWNLDPSKPDGLSERKFGDGFAVRGSRGFSIDEIMYPKSYHKNLVLEEAEWELLIKIEELKAKHGQNALKNPKVASQIEAVRRLILKGWLDSLDVSTKAIDAEVELYFIKYRITEDSPIWERKAALQKEMNKKYKRITLKFERLISLLNRDKVCAHSDLFYGNRVSRAGYGSELPEKGRIGAGKSLGDYLMDAGLAGYKMGHKFRKRLNIA